MKFIDKIDLNCKTGQERFSEIKAKIKKANDVFWNTLKKDGPSAIKFKDIRQYSWAMESTNTPGVVKIYAFRNEEYEAAARKKVQNVQLRNKDVAANDLDALFD